MSNNIGRELGVYQCRKGQGEHFCLTILVGSVCV